MRISVLATDVWASEKMKHVDASAMHAATSQTGRPPSPPLRDDAAAAGRLSTSGQERREAKKLRHRLVVQGSVRTRRTMSPPLLQHSAAAATSRAPRRAAGVVDPGVTRYRGEGREFAATRGQSCLNVVSCRERPGGHVGGRCGSPHRS